MAAQFSILVLNTMKIKILLIIATKPVKYVRINLYEKM